MKANEFRIGNTVSFSGRVLNCSYHDISNMAKMEITEGKISDIYEPIPLTKEWLLKFKWFEIKDGQFIFKDNNYLSINEDGCLYVENNYVANEDISFVHQLQNLHFALTGEELVLI